MTPDQVEVALLISDLPMMVASLQRSPAMGDVALCIVCSTASVQV